MPQSRIYTHPTQKDIDLPNLDLLSLLFDSELSASQEDTVLHCEAANPSNKLTKADLRQVSQRISHGLRQHYGIGANGPDKDVVTVITYGQILTSAALYGIIGAGGVYSAASPSSTVEELARQVNIGKSNLIICGSEHKDVATQAAKSCGLPARNVLVLDSTAGAWSLRSIEGGVEAISRQRLLWEKITDPKRLKDSLIVILWSSGTTGEYYVTVVCREFVTSLST